MRPEELFEHMRAPAPPSDLRQRTLAAAGVALDGESKMDVWSRLWYSRTCRLAWLSCIVVLVLGNILTAVDRPSSVANAVATAPPELEEVVRLAPISFECEAPSALLAAVTSAPSHEEEESVS